MKTLRSSFLILVTVLALFVSITGFVAKIDLASRLLQLLFLPVTAYLLYALLNHIFNRTPVFEQKTGLQRVVIYYCFILTSTVVSLSFFSSRDTAQFISSLIFSPMALYFLLLVWPRHKEALLLSAGGTTTNRQSGFKSSIAPSTKLDVDRRNFLKLIGSAGILAVILGLFSKRSGIPNFLGNVGNMESVTLKNTSGNVINPAESSPTEGYNISQIDDSVPSYFGFVNKEGAWFIMKECEDGAYLYAKGNAEFTKNWSNRAKLAYNSFDSVF